MKNLWAWLLGVGCVTVGCGDDAASPTSGGGGAPQGSVAGPAGNGSSGSAPTASSAHSSVAASTDGASSAGGTGAGGAGPCMSPWVSDDLEWDNVDEALANGPWTGGEGDVSISTNYHHSGTRSLRIAYDSNEAASYLVLQIPGGSDHFFARWWELRERAGDFAGAQDFDWGGEKLNRFRSNVIGVEPDGGLDYPLGWSGKGGFGQTGTQDGGEISLFGNSAASNDDIHFARPYAMPRGEWHAFELELDLGTTGIADGAARLYVDGDLFAERTDVALRPMTTALVEQVWIGGWYSNLGVDPEPSPAVRYVDDVVLCSERIGL